jgi:hypothetical protein
MVSHAGVASNPSKVIVAKININKAMIEGETFSFLSNPTE